MHVMDWIKSRLTSEFTCCGKSTNTLASQIAACFAISANLMYIVAYFTSYWALGKISDNDIDGNNYQVFINLSVWELCAIWPKGTTTKWKHCWSLHYNAAANSDQLIVTGGFVAFQILCTFNLFFILVGLTLSLVYITCKNLNYSRTCAIYLTMFHITGAIIVFSCCTLFVMEKDNIITQIQEIDECSKTVNFSIVFYFISGLCLLLCGSLMLSELFLYDYKKNPYEEYFQRYVEQISEEQY